MSRTFSHSPALWHAFPQLRVAALVAEGITPEANVESLIAPHLESAKHRAARSLESALPPIVAWRRVYAQMGLKPTQYRCAAESLLRRLRTAGELPALHPLVSVCNALSASFAIPVAALDLGRIEGDLRVVAATGAERYLAFGGAVEFPDCGEVIYADSAGYAHSRRWVTRQSGRSAISPQTTRALIVAEAVHDAVDADLDRLQAALAEGITSVWGTVPRQGRLTAISPSMELDPEMRRLQATVIRVRARARPW